MASIKSSGIILSFLAALTSCHADFEKKDPNTPNVNAKQDEPAINYCEAPIIVGDFQSGDGSAAAPFAICNLDQLNHFVTFCDSTAPDDCLALNFILGDNIDLTSETFAPINSFRGVFNGNNKTISNWSHHSADLTDPAGTIQANPAHVDYHAGFFRVLGSGAEIKNITLSNVTLRGRYYTGALAGLAQAGSVIKNSHATTSGSDVRNNTTGVIIGFNNIPTAGGSTGHTGGLVGKLDVTASISDSSFRGLVRGAMHVGGLVGLNMGSITASRTSGGILGRDGNAGGFIGANDGGTVSDSYSTVSVLDDIGNSGGFVGSVGTNSLITRSYYNGSIIGGVYGVGGFAGYIIGANAKVTKCYSSGSVVGNSTGSYAGGFVGWVNDGGVVEDSYSTASVTSLAWAGGFAGVVSNSAGVGTLTRVYSTGIAISSHASNLAGDLLGFLGNTGVVTAAFAKMDAFSGGLVHTPNAGVITDSSSLAVGDMKLSATYTNAGWDFSGVWKRSDAANNGMPELRL